MDDAGTPEVSVAISEDGQNELGNAPEWTEPVNSDVEETPDVVDDELGPFMKLPISLDVVPRMQRMYRLPYREVALQRPQNVAPLSTLPFYEEFDTTVMEQRALTGSFPIFALCTSHTLTVATLRKLVKLNDNGTMSKQCEYVFRLAIQAWHVFRSSIVREDRSPCDVTICNVDNVKQFATDECAHTNKLQLTTPPATKAVIAVVKAQRLIYVVYFYPAEGESEEDRTTYVLKHMIFSFTQQRTGDVLLQTAIQVACAKYDFPRYGISPHIQNTYAASVSTIVKSVILVKGSDDMPPLDGLEEFDRNLNQVIVPRVTKFLNADEKELAAMGFELNDEWKEHISLETMRRWCDKTKWAVVTVDEFIANPRDDALILDETRQFWSVCGRISGLTFRFNFSAELQDVESTRKYEPPPQTDTLPCTAAQSAIFAALACIMSSCEGAQSVIALHPTANTYSIDRWRWMFSTVPSLKVFMQPLMKEPAEFYDPFHPPTKEAHKE